MIVVVTGPTSGIGAAFVARALARGDSVIGVARDESKLAALAAKHGGNFRGVQADLADPAARARAIEILVAEPKIDALVNNAAECVYASPLDQPVDALRRLLEINVLAVIDLVRALAPKLGHVVNISSVTARFLPSARFGAYGLTKAALDHATEAMRLELEGRGVRVTSIVPGLVDTPIYDKVQGFERARAKLREQLPTWLAPEDVAEAIHWALDRPPHVVAAEIVLLPRGQSR